MLSVEQFIVGRNGSGCGNTYPFLKQKQAGKALQLYISISLYYLLSILIDAALVQLKRQWIGGCNRDLKT